MEFIKGMGCVWRGCRQQGRLIAPCKVCISTVPGGQMLVTGLSITVFGQVIRGATIGLVYILYAAAIAVFYLFIFADSGLVLDKNQLAIRSALVTARSISNAAVSIKKFIAKDLAKNNFLKLASCIGCADQK